MKKLLRGKKLNILYSLAAVAIILVVWVIAYYSIRNDYILPSVSQSFSALFECFASGEFWLSVANTFLRTLCAFAISFVLAALLSALSAVCKPFKGIFAAIISLIRTLPTMAVTLMLLIWTNPLTAPVVVAVLVLFPMIYSQFTTAIDGVDADLLQMAKVYSFTRKDKLVKIILPQVAPSILGEVGANLSLGIKLMVSAEVLCYTFHSLGGLMQQAKLYAEMPTFAALTIACILIGFIMEWLSSFLRLLTLRWSRKEGANEDN
ncbi:MAG: ABC transporter permease [Candidatus Coproplasma sp.]